MGVRRDDDLTPRDLAANLGLLAWCPTSQSEDCDRACHVARCHESEHQHRRYSAESTHGRYVPVALPGVDALGWPREGRRFSGERYAKAAPRADVLLTLQGGETGGETDETRHFGLCASHWRQRLRDAEGDWATQVRRIACGEPSLFEHLAREQGDLVTAEQVRQEEQVWLLHAGRRYRSLFDLATQRGWLRVTALNTALKGRDAPAPRSRPFWQRLFRTHT